MIAHLLIQKYQDTNRMTILTVPIFGDCIICEEMREVNNDSTIFIKNKRIRVSIISCNCSRSLIHQSLLAETEIIDICAEAQILTTG